MMSRPLSAMVATASIVFLIILASALGAMHTATRAGSSAAATLRDLDRDDRQIEGFMAHLAGSPAQRPRTGVFSSGIADPVLYMLIMYKGAASLAA